MPDRKPRTANLGLATFEVVERALRHLSLTRAARELGVSQRTVSFHVDRFEAHFGYPVLRRVGNMLQRTEAGDRVMEICRTINELADLPAADLNLGLDYLPDQMPAKDFERFFENLRACLCAR